MHRQLLSLDQGHVPESGPRQLGTISQNDMLEAVWD